MSQLQNKAVGLLHRVEINTSEADWQQVLLALLVSNAEDTRLGYPPLFLLKCLNKRVPVGASLRTLQPCALVRAGTACTCSDCGCAVCGMLICVQVSGLVCLHTCRFASCRRSHIGRIPADERGGTRERVLGAMANCS